MSWLSSGADQVANAAGKAMAPLAFILETKRGGPFGYLADRSAILNDPTSRAGLTDSPFSAGLLGLSGSDKATAGPALPQGMQGPPAPQTKWTPQLPALTSEAGVKEKQSQVLQQMLDRAQAGDLGAKVAAGIPLNSEEMTQRQAEAQALAQHTGSKVTVDKDGSFKVQFGGNTKSYATIQDAAGAVGAVESQGGRAMVVPAPGGGFNVKAGFAPQGKEGPEAGVARTKAMLEFLGSADGKKLLAGLGEGTSVGADGTITPGKAPAPGAPPVDPNAPPSPMRVPGDGTVTDPALTTKEGQDAATRTTLGKDWKPGDNPAAHGAAGGAGAPVATPVAGPKRPKARPLAPNVTTAQVPGVYPTNPAGGAFVDGAAYPPPAFSDGRTAPPPTPTSGPESQPRIAIKGPIGTPQNPPRVSVSSKGGVTVTTGGMPRAAGKPELYRIAQGQWPDNPWKLTPELAGNTLDYLTMPAKAKEDALKSYQTIVQARQLRDIMSRSTDVQRTLHNPMMRTWAYMMYMVGAESMLPPDVRTYENTVAFFQQRAIQAYLGGFRSQQAREDIKLHTPYWYDDLDGAYQKTRDIEHWSTSNIRAPLLANAILRGQPIEDVLEVWSLPNAKAPAAAGDPGSTDAERPLSGGAYKIYHEGSVAP